MSRIDLMGPQQHSLRKFPQRSQSLRVKSPPSRLVPLRSGGVSSVSPTANTSRSPMSTSTKLIVTSQDLIIQDIFCYTPTASDASSLGANKQFSLGEQSDAISSFGASLRTNRPFHQSMTLNRHASIRRYRQANCDLANSNTVNDKSATTLFINCPFAPHTPLNQANVREPYSDAKSYCSEHKNKTDEVCDKNGDEVDSGLKLCTTSSLEDGSMEDEGVITHEDNLEESEEDDDEEDYFDFEEDTDESYQSQSRQVHLLRHSHLGLGLSIKGGSDYASPVIVAAIRPGTPADICANIFVGDQILSVNEVPVNETTSHQDALRLLSECGDKVCLVLRHCKAIVGHRKRWKRPRTLAVLASNSRQKSLPNLMDSLAKNIDYDATRAADKQQSSMAVNTKRFSKSNSMNSLSHYLRIDLFLAGISQYVLYSDQLRDASFEVRTLDGNSVVVQCTTDEISAQWCQLIKSTIDSLTDSFIQYFNKHYPQREHIFYMGWVSECLSNEMSSVVDSPSLLTQHSLSGYRWLSRYLIIKGGDIYLFKVPPASTLRRFRQKIASTSRRNHSGSSGSSLGSVGSSGSDASNSSNSTHLNSSFDLNHQNSHDVMLARLRKAKPDRLIRLNKELQNELCQQSIAKFNCSNSNFRIVKTKELSDDKQHCFIINNGTATRKYYSTENFPDLERLEASWTKANYQSISKLKSKTFTAMLIDENVFGSLILDWRFGFTFYDPKRKSYLWSYKFHQLKHSSDDGKSRLWLTFVTDPNDNQATSTHVLKCSCLQTLIYCIHAFLGAKVYSLYL